MSYTFIACRNEQFRIHVMNHKFSSIDHVALPTKDHSSKFPIKMLNISDVMYITAKSRSWVYSKMSKTDKNYDPTFPTPIKVAGSTNLWVESELIDWLRKCIELSRHSSEVSSHVSH